MSTCWTSAANEIQDTLSDSVCTIDQIAAIIKKHVHQYWEMSKWEKCPDRWEVCSLCGPMVRCGNCGNNCCNGSSGRAGRGADCDCDSAYAMQEQDQVPEVVTAFWNYLESDKEKK